MNQQKFTIQTQKRVIYVLDEIIGEGTGGSVHKAQRVCNNQKQYVAIKLQPFLNDTEQITLEILRQQKLNYNINILDIDSYNNSHVIIMDLADGSFQNFWKNSRIIDVQEILHYFIQIVQGTNELHKLSLIHRDLKLDNIVYQERDNVKYLKLCDTGLIRQQNGRKTMTVGTPYYMSPEQINQSIYDEKVDIWALGMILYEMLAKQTMVTGNSIQEILNSILNLNQDQINSKIDKLFIQNQQYSYDIKNLLKMMIIKESQKRVNAEFIIKELQRILNINSLQHNDNHQFQDSIIKPEIREQLRIEIQKEFEQKYQQEYQKLNEQHKLEMEKSKNEIIEQYQQLQIQQKIEVQKETEEYLKAKQQKELNLLQEEYNKKILNCNQKQIEELEYEKQKIIKQMEQDYQIMFQQELKKKELDIQKEMEVQIQTQINNREQFNKLLLQQQLQKQYQEEFEKKSRNLAQFQIKLMSVQQNLDKSKILIENQLQNLNGISKLNKSQKYQKFISDYQKQLQDKLKQQESINMSLSQLVINSNFQQYQYQNLIDANNQNLVKIQNSSQEFISPYLVESFIQNSNQLLENIREEQKQLQIQHEKSRLKEQLENSEKDISKLQDLFSKQKEQINEVNSIIDNLNQLDNESIQKQEILNQQYNQLYIEFQILNNSIKLTKEEEQKVEILEKQNKQLVNLVDKLNQFKLNFSSFIQKVQEQKDREQDNISNQLQNFIETIYDWEQKIDYLNQEQQTQFFEELKEQFEKLNQELEVLLEIKNRIIQLINDIKQNQKQNYFKQFSNIQQEYQISIYKLELIENYYQKEQRKQQFKTKELLCVQEEQKTIDSSLKQLFESVQQRMNNLQNQLQNLSNRCNDNIQLQYLSKQLELIINIFDNHKKIAQEIDISLIEFEKSNFQTINDIKLAESKIITSIKLFSHNLDPLFDSMNEISKQIIQSEDIYWDYDLKTLINSKDNLKVQLHDVKLNQKQEEYYKTLNDSKKELQNNIENCLKQCQKDIQNENILSQFLIIRNNKYYSKEMQMILTRMKKKIETFNTWIEEQTIRIQEIQNQVQIYENQKGKLIIGDFIQDYQQINSFIENLEIQLSELQQQKNKHKLNEYNELIQSYQKRIIELKSQKQQNQSYFKNLNFYAQQNQILNCLDALFQLYCLNGRDKMNLELQKINLNSQQQKQLKKDSELQKTIESINKIQNCFNILQQKDFFNVEMFAESIKNYLILHDQKNDFLNEIEFEQQLQQLLEIIKALIQQKQNNIYQKNKVKIKGRIKQNHQMIETLKTSFHFHIPTCQQLIPIQIEIQQNLDQEIQKINNCN